MCGFNLVCKLGIEDNSFVSLNKFDDWYFEFYLYLMDYIFFNDVEEYKVLEIGLGYGIVV